MYLVISEFREKYFTVLYNRERRQDKTEEMKFKFTSICLVCVSVVCGGEEHTHHHPAEHHHNHEDHHLAHGLNHSHPAHEDHQLVHEDHEHPHHKVPIPDTDLPLAARDYRVWLAATGIHAPNSKSQ